MDAEKPLSVSLSVLRNADRFILQFREEKISFEELVDHLKTGGLLHFPLRADFLDRVSLGRGFEEEFWWVLEEWVRQYRVGWANFRVRWSALEHWGSRPQVVEEWGGRFPLDYPHVALEEFPRLKTLEDYPGKFRVVEFGNQKVALIEEPERVEVILEPEETPESIIENMIQEPWTALFGRSHQLSWENLLENEA